MSSTPIPTHFTLWNLNLLTSCLSWVITTNPRSLASLSISVSSVPGGTFSVSHPSSFRNRSNPYGSPSSKRSTGLWGPEALLFILQPEVWIAYEYCQIPQWLDTLSYRAVNCSWWDHEHRTR